MAYYTNAAPPGLLDPFGTPQGQGILNGSFATPTQAQPGFSPMPAQPQPQQPQQSPQSNPFGGFLQGNSNTLMSLGSALLSQPSFGMALANFGQQAPQAIGSDRRRSALNAFLKAKSGKTQLDPATLQLLQSDPDFAEKYALSGLIPKSPIEVSKGASLYDPNTGSFVTPPGAGGGIGDIPSGYMLGPDGKSLVAQPGGPDDPNNPNSKASNQNLDNETRLRSDYVTQNKDFAATRDNWSRMLASSKGNTGASDIAMVYGFMKMLDPTSVVREGEYATAANAGGIPERVRLMYNNAIEGRKLDPVVREQFLQEGSRQYAAALERFRASQTQTRKLAQQYGADPSRVAIDLTNGVFPYLGGAAGALRDGAPAQPSVMQFKEGDTATNPTTGQRVIRRNGQWVPL